MNKFISENIEDEEIIKYAHNILLVERNVNLSPGEVWSFLNKTGLIHEARRWGASDTVFLDSVVIKFDKE